MLGNSKLKNAFRLSCKVNAYVPATIHNEPIDNTPYVDKVAALMAECFGGATSTSAIGYWLSPSVGLIKEKTTIVLSYCNSEKLEANIDRVIDLMEELKIELKQEAMALEINGDMYFI